MGKIHISIVLDSMEEFEEFCTHNSGMVAGSAPQAVIGDPVLPDDAAVLTDGVTAVATTLSKGADAAKAKKVEPAKKPRGRGRPPGAKNKSKTEKPKAEIAAVTDLPALPPAGTASEPGTEEDPRQLKLVKDEPDLATITSVAKAFTKEHGTPALRERLIKAKVTRITELKGKELIKFVKALRRDAKPAKE
jgi:hypothetical protein